MHSRIADAPSFVVSSLSEEAAFNRLVDSNLYFERRLNQRKADTVVVAEGDSWFDYLPAWFEDPVKGDLLGHLQRLHGFNIYRVSSAGDTIENMVYGTDYDAGDWTPERSQIEKTLAAIQKYKPEVFLFCGGGNDIAGQELVAYLNHFDSGLPWKRMEYINYIFQSVITKAFKDLIQRVRTVAPDLNIFFHGYDYAYPDGRGVIRVVPGWQYIGPWLKPTLTEKRVPEALQRDFIKLLLDALNIVLQSLHDPAKKIHHINLRNTLQAAIYTDDWANELHPTAKGFAKLASRMNCCIRKVVPKREGTQG